MRQHDMVDEIGLQRDRRVLAHQAHPVGKPGLPERRLGMVGVERRHFPQALLPPERADDEAERPLHAGARRSAAPEGGARRHAAISTLASTSSQNTGRGPDRIGDPRDDIGKRVWVHRTCLPAGGMIAAAPAPPFSGDAHKGGKDAPARFHGAAQIA